MNIIKMDLKLTRKNFIIWAISLSIITVLISLFFSSFRESMEAIEQLLKAFPKSITDSMGIDLNMFSSFPAYLSYIIGYILIALCIYAMQLGLTITSREKTIGMSDFLIAKPTSRIRIVVDKYIVSIIRVSLLTVLLFILSIMLNAYYDGSNIHSIVRIFIAALLIEFFFISLGAFISSLMKQNKSILPISMVTVFIMFFITMIERMFQDETLKYLSPFSHMDISKIVITSSFESKLVMLNIALTILLFLLSIIMYNREDFRK